MQQFVVQTREDRDTLMRESKKQQLNVNIVMTPPVKPQRITDISKLKRFGITAWLDETFTCPEPVMWSLYENMRVDRIACGTAKTSKHLKQVLGDGSPLTMLLTPDTRYNRTTSRYANVSSTRTMALRQAQVFGAANPEEKQRLESSIHSLQQERSNIDAELVKLQEEFKALRSELDSLKGKIHLDTACKQLRSFNSRLQSRERQLNALNNETDTETEESIKESIAELLKLRKKGCKKLLDIMSVFVSRQVLQDKDELQVLQFEQEITTLSLQQNAFSSRLRELERSVGVCSNLFEEAKKLALKLQRDAKEKCKLTEEMKEIFSTLPGTLEEVDEAIHVAKARADLTTVHNPHILQEYDQRMAQIRRLEGILEKSGQDKQQLLDRIEEESRGE